VKTTPPASRRTYVCPWWLVHTFDNPLRRLLQNPERILGGLVRPGDACVDLGCGIGYFTIPMARLVGPAGSVTAVDLQPEMLAGVEKRARQSELLDRVSLHRADASGLHLAATFDFALAFWVAHEVPDQLSLFNQIRLALRPGGRLLLVEPLGHVGRKAFFDTVGVAAQAGLVAADRPRVSLSRAVVLTVG
jgi:ubiquinone/menaquinone biosynthesis C-methylase UbiE